MLQCAAMNSALAGDTLFRNVGGLRSTRSVEELLAAR